ncbi:hypothetical protein TanjilG_09076 [Lupinus angustifolius]|uniref:Transmembrane protein n=1 Tax=Lupinus angustifolius TaxID=3871 RepID=A0A394DGB9_LUPAN|nr:PREDICTED: uncharacterized protein LOC109340489 [Lupinus angustifolius]OIW21739.1 hypothetical protein TanjilG_09076 [Lupinus angustifolius]
MNVLDSLLQPLPFNYYFTFITSNHLLWTWLTLITTAITFWKIRPSPPFLKPDYNSVPTQTEPTITTPPLSKPLVLTEDIDGVRKMKFTVYYEEDEVQCKCSENDEKEELLTMTATENWNEEEEEEELEWWERVLRLKNGENENGWYMFQDLTELNGNVVRLWDGGLRFQSG